MQRRLTLLFVLRPVGRRGSANGPLFINLTSSALKGKREMFGGCGWLETVAPVSVARPKYPFSSSSVLPCIFPFFSQATTATSGWDKIASS